MQRKGLLATLGAVVMALGTPTLADPTSILPADAKQICSLNQTDFQKEWVTLTFPEARGNPISGDTIGPFYDDRSGLVYVFPNDGPGFVEGEYGQPDDCAFFFWGNQMFYWLTSSLEDGKMTHKPANPISPPGDTKYVFASEFFYHVLEDGKDSKGNTTYELEPQDFDGPNSQSTRTRTSKPTDADGVGQAGRTNGVLFTQPSGDVSAHGSMVYYSIHMNRTAGYIRAFQLDDSFMAKLESWFFEFDQFPDTAEKTCEALYYGLLNGYFVLDTEFAPLTVAVLDSYCPVSWVQDILGEIEDVAGMALHELEKEFPILKELVKYIEGETGNLQNLPAIEDLIPYVEPGIDYLSMGMEVKASWVLASSLKNTDDFILRTGYIPTYSDPDANGNMVQTGTELVDLALIGMHVVGNVAGHPEMVWATMEHYSNTPNVDYTYIDTNDAPKTWSDLNQLPATSWLVSDGSSNAVNNEYAIFHEKDGATYPVNTIAPVSSTQTEPVNQHSNVHRLSPWGSPNNANSAEVNSQLISANASVYSTLSNYYKGTGINDPRLNYVLTGASWGKDGIFPTGDTTSEILGTPSMANTTMETFTQKFGSSVNETGCFACHGIDAGDSKFSISHIFEHVVQVNK